MTLTAPAAALPFLFGPPERRLFASHHAPPPGPARDRCVLVCPPVGQEQIRSQRALWRLASRLAGEGFHAFRFDPYGTGDSAGEAWEGDLDGWRDDLLRAAAAARARSGTAGLCLVGLRLGAALAATAAAGRDDVDALVLWEPVTVGERHLAELEARHRSHLRRFPAPLPRSVRREPFGELLGFPLSEAQRRELQAIDLRSLAAAPAGEVLVLERDERAGRELAEALRALGARVDVELTADEQMWIDDINRMLVPERAIGAVVDWLAEGRR